MRSIPICKSFDIYINPNSTEIIELGTIDYPYKSLGLAFVELLNYHSHSNSSITIHIMEDTINYILVDSNYIINITQVTIKPYSNGSGVPNKATIVGREDNVVYFSSNSMFNLINDTTLNTDENIYNVSEIDDSSKTTISLVDYSILIYQSQVLWSDLKIQTEYNSLATLNYFIRAVYIQDRDINITDIDIQVSGGIIITTDPLNLYLVNLDIDFYQNIGGFDLRVQCNYPEAFLEETIYANNITFYFGTDRAVSGSIDGQFTYIGPGNLTMIDYYSDIYVDLTEFTLQFLTDIQTICDPDIDTTKTLDFQNTTFKLEYNPFGTLYNILFFRLDGGNYRNVVLTMNDSNFETINN